MAESFELTSREKEILQLISEGHSTEEIARQLGLNEKTIKRERTSIFAKFEAKNRAEAVGKGQRTGKISGKTPPSSYKPLSPTEKSIAPLLPEGCTNKEISTRLSMTESTVRKHIDNMREKLNCNNRADLVSVLLALKIIG